MPLLHRVRLGEGGLIGMATWVAAWQTRSAGPTAWVFVLTSVLLTALYLYNDVSDRKLDEHNPAKIPGHRVPLVRHPGRFFGVALATHAAVCVAAWRILGAWAASCAGALLVLNPFYSGIAKRVPGLDVVVVGTMGAAVVGIATSTPDLLLLAGTMTAISHAFQTRGDTAADRAAGILSSATAPAALREAIWLVSCAAFAWAVHVRLGSLWAASAVVPYVLLSRSPNANRAWARARVYFAVVWIAATTR